MQLYEMEQQYCDSLDNQWRQLKLLYEMMKTNARISLEEKEITKAILLRMKAYYDAQNKVKEFLNKRYLTAASDFFVETIVFYLKLTFELNNVNFEVHSERQIEQKKRAIRPDISIYKNGEILAIVECKTQFGWKRGSWEVDFFKREAALKENFPRSRAFLVVMTSKNWSGFQNDRGKIGTQYFTLSSNWPTAISQDKIEKTIINPIEGMFKELMKLT
jgi:hypothetical protein